MKKICFCILCFLLGLNLLRATHQQACEISFTHIKDYTYRIQITSYTFIQSPADRPELLVNWGDNEESLLSRSSRTLIPNTQTAINIYYGEHTYLGPGSYYISMTDENRNGGVINIPNSISTPMYVETLLVISPYMPEGNNSPILNSPPIDKACLGELFVHNPFAYDPDGDSLSYEITECKTFDGENIPGYTYPASSKTFYMDSVSGNLVWDAPIQQGEYNVAIRIKEWRNQRLIGEVTRDMQITVQACENACPELDVEEKQCVVAGGRFLFDVHAWDYDETEGLHVTADGEPFHLTNANTPRLSIIHQGIDSTVARFNWLTSLHLARKLPYPVYFKVKDNGDPNLQNIKTAYLHIIPPAVENLLAISQEDGISLQWSRHPSPKVSHYKIYRKEGPGGSEERDTCERGIYPGYVQVGSCNRWEDTSFLDLSPLVEGMVYSYRIVGMMDDGGESYPSREVLVQRPNYAPVLTQASIENTHETEGRIHLRWQNPADCSHFPSPTLHLYRGTTPETLNYLRSLSLQDTAYTDFNVNTVLQKHYYQLRLDTTSESYRSAAASAPFLTATAGSRKAYLHWSCDQPWHVYKTHIYRKDPGDPEFVSLGEVYGYFYTDTLLENGEKYTYKILTEGSYFNDSIESPLFNFSNEISVIPEVQPPCKPFLKMESSNCKPLSNYLVWSFDSNFTDEGKEECYDDIALYKIYFKKYSESEMSCLSQTESEDFEHLNPSTYFACYQVSAVNSIGEESERSNMVCSDNRHCFEYRLPNVFSPNGDGINDVFRAYPNQYVENFEISIYNTWGNFVYKSTDPNFEWNGNIHGGTKPCPDGAYFYIIKFTSKSEGIDFNAYQSGSITLLR